VAEEANRLRDEFVERSLSRWRSDSLSDDARRRWARLASRHDVIGARR